MLYKKKEKEVNKKEKCVFKVFEVRVCACRARERRRERASPNFAKQNANDSHIRDIR